MNSAIYCIKKISGFFSFTVILGTFSSCVTSNLQTASVKGLDAKSTAHLASEDTRARITLRPFFFKNIDKRTAINTNTHSTVNREGIFELEPVQGETDRYIEREGINNFTFTGRNLIWNRPVNNAGCDFEYTVDGKAVTVGITYGKVDGRPFFSSMFGGSIYRPRSVRAGFDLYYQSLAHDAVIIVADEYFSNGQRDVQVIKNEGRNDYLNYDLYLSWRSYFPRKTYVVDIFAEGAFGGQTLVKVDKVYSNGLFSDNELFYKDRFYSFTFGCFRNINENSRITAGYKMTFHRDNHHSDTRSDSFFLQYEYDFILSE